MIYLSRLTFKSRHPRTISEFNQPYEMHRTLCRGWADPTAARILFRSEMEKDGTVRVLVQSQVPPDWDRLRNHSDHLVGTEGPKPVAFAGFTAGQTLRFQLRCRPTRRIGAKDNPDKGKRESLTRSEEIFQWLSRKGKTCGFEVKEVVFERVSWFDSKNGSKEKPLGAIEFTGILKIDDPVMLQAAIANGIGTQKAFGFGLLSVARN